MGDIQKDARENGGRFRDGQRVRVLGAVQSVKQKLTKSNSTMAFVMLEDLYDSIEMLVFPNVYSQYTHLLRDGKIVLAEGRLSLTEEKDTKLVCDSVYPPPDAHTSLPSWKEPQGRPSKDEKKHTSRPGLYLKVPGATPLYLYLQDTGKLVRAPVSMNLDVNPVLLRELKKLLGEDCVALVKPDSL